MPSALVSALFLSLIAAGIQSAEAAETVHRIKTVHVGPTTTGTPRFAAEPSIPINPEDDSPEAVLEDLPYTPGRLIVKLSEDLGSESRRALRSANEFGVERLDKLCNRFGIRGMRTPYEGRTARAVSRGAGPTRRAARAPVNARAPRMDDIHVLDLSPYMDMEAVALEFEKIEGVEYAEPERFAEINFATNDPYLGSSGAWGQLFPDLWGLYRIDAQSAWDVTTGAGVLVAITDTGIDPTHPEIAAQMWSNSGEITDNLIDDDGNGYIDDTWGWDFVNDDNDPFDDNGHGTHVAGTVAATGNNALGMVGVAWNAQVMAVKGFSSGGGANTTWLVDVILYAADNGADIINASWAGFGESDLIKDAVDTAYAAGVVFVAAAANSAFDVAEFFPAKYAETIAVSAFDSTDQAASFTNFGNEIDVAAPGGGDDEPSNKYDPHRSILSLLSSGASSSLAPNQLIIDGIFLRQAGTSMAAPHVAGAAALVLANHPEFTIEQVRQVLRSSADDVGDPGVDAYGGYGRINVGAAVLIDSVPEVSIDDPVPGQVVSQNSVDIIGTAAGSDFATYTVEFGEGEYPTAWTQIDAVQATAVLGGVLISWDTSLVPDGDYVVRVNATTTLGDTFEDRVNIVLDRLLITDPVSYTIHRGGGEILEISGTAYGPGFNSFNVEYREILPDITEGAWSSAGIALTGGGGAPVFDGILATLDTSVLPVSRDLDFRVSVDGSGAYEGIFYHIVVDPDLRPGWPVKIPGLPQKYSRMEGHMSIADLDGNGTKEILAAYWDMVFVFNADGTDFPGWPKVFPDNDDEYGEYTDTAPAAADLDNDGDLELVTADGEDIYIWHHDGTPMTGWPKTFLFDPGGQGYIEGRPKGDFVLADFDGDGTRDIIFPWGDAIAVIDTAGNFLPGWPWDSESYLGSPIQSYLAVGDMNGDGLPEIAAIERTGSNNDPQYLNIFGQGAVQFERFPRKITRKHVADGAPILADMDSDGLLDVIVNRSKPKKLRAYNWQRRNVKMKTKIPAYKYKSPFAGKFISAQEILSAGDINGDGVPEVFVSTEWPQTRVKCRGGICTWTFLLGLKTGTNILQAVSHTQRYLIGWPYSWNFTRGDNAHGPGTAAIGDINGDGQQNVVVGTGMCWSALDYSYHRCYTIYAFNPDGSIVAGFPKATPSPGATDQVMPAIGDLDGDGLKEIVFADFDGNMLVWTVPGTPGPENMQWPMWRHDPARTGALR